MENAWLHTTVLLNEAVDSLLNGADTATGTFVDATFGRGGHSRRILERLGPQARLIAFDKDPEAIAEAGRLGDARFSIRHEGFRHLAELPAGLTVVALAAHVFATVFGLPKSNGEIRRQFVTAGAVQLNGARLDDPNATVTLRPGDVLRLSKKHAVRVR